jgi:hypothetical protein
VSTFRLESAFSLSSNIKRRNGIDGTTSEWIS